MQLWSIFLLSYTPDTANAARLTPDGTLKHLLFYFQTVISILRPVLSYWTKLTPAAMNIFLDAIVASESAYLSES